jgi:hypothetical protein
MKLKRKINLTKKTKKIKRMEIKIKIRNPKKFLIEG